MYPGPTAAPCIPFHTLPTSRRTPSLVSNLSLTTLSARLTSWKTSTRGKSRTKEGRGCSRAGGGTERMGTGTWSRSRKNRAPTRASRIDFIRFYHLLLISFGGSSEGAGRACLSLICFTSSMGWFSLVLSLHCFAGLGRPCCHLSRRGRGG